MYNGLILYYENPFVVRIRQLSLRVVQVKFRQVVISVCRLSLLYGNIYEQRYYSRYWYGFAGQRLIMRCTCS